MPERKLNRLLGYLLVLGAATSAGALGLLYTLISRRFGLAPETMIFVRLAIADLALVTGLAVFQPRLLKVQRSQLPGLVALGVVGYGLFHLTYARAILAAGVTVAAVLVYTAPLWVSLYGRLVLGETMDWRKALALLGALGGAVLVAQGYDLGRLRINVLGIALGVAAGIGAAGYIVLNKRAVRNCHPLTATVYALGASTLFFAAWQTPAGVWHAVSAPGAVWLLLALGLGPTLLSAVGWSAGLRYLPASVGSIVGAWEPVVAALVAYFALGERLQALQLLGAVAVLGSIVLLGSRDLHERTGSVSAESFD